MKYFITFIFAFLSVYSTYAQEGEEEEGKSKPRPERPAFESAVLLENQSDVVNYAKTLEWNIQHRFAPVSNGISDMYGIFGPSNIRLGFSYTVIDRVGIGLGLSKTSKTGSNPFIDLNAKVKLLQQGRKGGSPVNVTYFVNMGVDTRPETETQFPEAVERLSYFHDLIISRRLSKKFSLLASVQAAHFNAVDSLHKWNVYGVRLAGRHKISSQSSILFEWSEPLSEHDIINSLDPDYQRDAGPKRNFGIGWEIATSSHAFQITFGAYRDIVPQWNLHRNTNLWRVDDNNGDKKWSFVVGFNMTRLWSF